MRLLSEANPTFGRCGQYSRRGFEIAGGGGRNWGRDALGISPHDFATNKILQCSGSLQGHLSGDRHKILIGELGDDGLHQGSSIAVPRPRLYVIQLAGARGLRR
jgi:hypothetical protein